MMGDSSLTYDFGGGYALPSGATDPNSITYDFGNGYALPAGTPMDKPIYNAAGQVLPPSVTGTSIAVIAVAVFLLIVIGKKL